MANSKYWFSCALFVFISDIFTDPASVASSFQESFTQAQDATNFFTTAPDLWQNYQQQTPLRQKLSLHGRWRATCDDPEFSGEVELPAAFSFEGQVVFQRLFRLDSTFMNRPLRLLIQGTNYETKVELNGDLVGSHEGGYTSVMIDLRPERIFFDKENLLILTVNNQLSPLETLPAKQRPWGWPNEGGILREIYLEALPEIFFENFKPHYKFEPSAVAFNLSAEVRSSQKLTPEQSAGVTAIVEIWEDNRLNKLSASPAVPLVQSDRLRQTLALSCQINQPTLWSPVSPYLYAVRLALLRQNEIIDEWWLDTGFRKLEMIDRQFWLNGEPFVVRGVNWIEDYGNGSTLLDTTKAMKLLAEVKELGANAIRVIGHPPHPALPALCDRFGIFLLEELPLYYLTETHFRQPQFIELTMVQAREMIFRDLMHPSLLSWGMGANSALFSPDVRNTLNHLGQELRRLDDRPLYAAAPPAWAAGWEPIVDFVLPDLFEEESATSFLSLAINSQKPLLPIIGFWARHDLLVQEKENLDEQHQAEKLDDLFEKLEEAPKFAGYFIQALIDWPSSMPVLVLGPAGGRVSPNAAGFGVAKGAGKFIYPAGMLDDAGRRRMAFQVVQAFNRGDRRPMLIAKKAPAIYPQEYPIVGISVLFVGLFFLNRDRRLRDNLQRVFVHPHGFYVDVYENRKVPPFLTTLLGLMESCVVAILFSGFCYANRESLIFDQIMNLIVNDPIWKARAVWLVWHPGWFIAAVTAGLFLLGVTAAVFLRILGFFLGRGLPVPQYYTFVFWMAANLLVLGIVAPFFYRLLLYSDFAPPLLFVVVLTFLWLAVRFFRGLRVIYTMSFLRTAIIFSIIVGGLFVSFAFYYQRTEAIFEYAKYYWQLLNLWT